MYKCNSCGATFKRKQFGDCPKCGTFQDFSEIVAPPSRSGGKSSSSSSSNVSYAPLQRLSEVEAVDHGERISTGFSEFDRVLGGGLVPDSAILFSGSPGAGKSTLSLSAASHISQSTGPVLYVSGEESEGQISLRGKRLGLDMSNIFVVHETHAEAIVSYIYEVKPVFVVVDSVQTFTAEGITSQAGSVSQAKAVTDMLTLTAKREHVAVCLISQVVKSEDFAGSKSNQHIVDATLMLDTDKTSPLRFLRAEKNRFGATDEVGIFQHTDSGLEEIINPNQIAIDEDTVSGVAGTAISLFSEGNRHFPVEIQALCLESSFNNPRKIFNGVTSGKGHAICAILDKHCRAGVNDCDVYVSTVAGVNVTSPTCDLALAVAMFTSAKEVDLPEGYCFLGEVSLTGGIRRTASTVRAGVEAARLGYTTIVVPKSAKADIVNKVDPSVTVVGLKNVRDIKRLVDKVGKKDTLADKLAQKAGESSSSARANTKRYYKKRKKDEDIKE